VSKHFGNKIERYLKEKENNLSRNKQRMRTKVEQIIREFTKSEKRQQERREKSKSRSREWRKTEREKVLKELEPILKEMREKELAKLKALNELGISEYSAIKPNEKIEYTPPWETWERKK
jgi:hypothetical protein